MPTHTDGDGAGPSIPALADAIGRLLTSESLRRDLGREAAGVLHHLAEEYARRLAEAITTSG